jgi:ABC-type nitrate/sulfonate/bicarbonate transport system substrate-binding protein
MKKRLFTVTGLVVIILAMVLGAMSCRSGYTAEPEPITFGTVLLEPSLPLFVAEDQNLFVRNGLDVTF